MPVEKPRTILRAQRTSKDLTKGITKNMTADADREAMTAFRYPTGPAKIPERKRERPYPSDMKPKRLPAPAWVMANSSSRRGMMGEKIVRTLKFMNQTNQRKKSIPRAFPPNPSNRAMNLNVPPEA